MEVGVIHEVPVGCAHGIKSCAEAHGVGAATGSVENGLGIKLGSAVVDVAAQEILDSLFVVKLQHDAFLALGSPFQSEDRCHRFIFVGISYLVIELRSHGNTVV